MAHVRTNLTTRLVSSTPAEYSREYIIVKMKYLENMLTRLPNVTLGKHGKCEVVYVSEKINNQTIRHQHIISSPQGKKYADVARCRKQLKREYSRLRRLYNHNYSQYQVKLRPPRCFPIQIKDRLVPDNNPHEKEGDYWHNGIQMRSRFEKSVATILDSLGLEYMYEVSITINGEIYNPDFVVFLPELGCCFIIECLGKVDDIRYLHRNKSKFIDYMNFGLYPNQNLLLLCGTKSYIPTDEDIKNDIINLINNATRNLATIIYCDDCCGSGSNFVF
ncbi:MAG: hypothetical protein MJ093_03070 [Saccharofermentans sp.]|nr:hypothetical protein [Saccharofermentans sp.]